VANLSLKAAKRDILGKKSRFLRRQGVTPAHIFGHGIESLALQCDTAELQRVISQGGTTRLIDVSIEAEDIPRSVFIREIQKDQLSGQLLHVDFYQIKMTEEITAEIPIILVGEAPAAKSKENIIEHILNQLEVSCLPGRIPPQIEVDLAPLEEAGDAIHVRDIALGEGIATTADPDQLIVKVSKIKIAVEKEAVAEVTEEEEAAAEAEQAEEGAAPAEERAEE